MYIYATHIYIGVFIFRCMIFNVDNIHTYFYLSLSPYIYVWTELTTIIPKTQNYQPIQTNASGESYVEICQKNT